jgi:hypothetical protein
MSTRTGHFEVDCPVCKGRHSLEMPRFQNVPFDGTNIPRPPEFGPEPTSCKGVPYEVAPEILKFVPDSLIAVLRLAREENWSNSPRMVSRISDSIVMAKRIYDRMK